MDLLFFFILTTKISATDKHEIRSAYLSWVLPLCRLGDMVHEVDLGVGGLVVNRYILVKRKISAIVIALICTFSKKGNLKALHLLIRFIMISLLGNIYFGLTGKDFNYYVNSKYVFIQKKSEIDFFSQNSAKPLLKFRNIAFVISAAVSMACISVPWPSPSRGAGVPGRPRLQHRSSVAAGDGSPDCGSKQRVR